jgi:putative transposase
VVQFIGTHLGRRVGTDGLIWGVESMCTVLTEHGMSIAPSTYYDHVNRGPSDRDRRDAWHINMIHDLRTTERFGSVLGARKTWVVLNSRGHSVARCTVERLMHLMGWRGAIKGRAVRTTRPDRSHDRAPDLVQRRFLAGAPDRLWVADFTYCRTAAGWAYTAFVTDVFARRIVGWKVATEMTVDLVQAAVDQGIHSRKRWGATAFDTLIHHSDAGAQYTAVSYSTTLTEQGIRPSIGSIGDSFDNALAESVNSSYKTELVYREAPWAGLRDLEMATAEWVHWYNHGRPNGYCADLTPARAEQLYYDRQQPHHEVGAAS